MKMETLLVIVLFAILIYLLIARGKKRYRPTNTSKARSVSNIADQLYFVETASFEKRNLMNKKEYYLFRNIEAYLQKNHPTFRVFPQVSMGEFLSSKSDNAYSSINSKRVDFIIISKFGQPCIAIEYQGTGHYQNNAISRDAVKKEACRKAGIRYIEFEASYRDEDMASIGRYLSQLQ
ncbi:DUF2726 domain-containing protein [Jejubacter calystegiae]|uniref:DUF2726 domain-containing protein n=1 Tax=Jejubacter calystegiae TaxID=2579935 RepID=A0A4P8YEF0_9ENTR|nr:DUF2726 domain-containing protein [Jejubacter calystegiae]QCT18995.1 DUF2726 domain-containing protein [Jejubacter calystegiae]